MKKNVKSLDERFMQRALRLAKKGLGQTSPNPAVGAVVVKDGVIVGEGYHQRAGAPHAEVNAINVAGEAARGGVIYVTLEPCNHYGRTPPCTKAILEAGIQRVVIGAADPNPNVTGGGAEFLRSMGIEVSLGCMEDECRIVLAPFAKHAVTGFPWVRAKAAMSLDGRIATRTSESRWITNDRARSAGHGLRAISDAILVGIGTVAADDPRLTVRISGKTARCPVRFVLDSGLRIDLGSRVLNQPGLTVVVGAEGRASSEKKKALEEIGAEVWLMPSNRCGRPDIGAVLKKMGEMGLQSVLIEGGAAIHGAFWDKGLIDEAFFFYAPIIIGGEDAYPAIGGSGVSRLDAAPRLKFITHRRFEDNWLVHGLVTELDRFWRRKCSRA
ncbi:MAG: bifunctional diaminohydroxyphosphoribosylaminopyrimidine deaminase/5-amino-6-(5-phosphoribosylamino)uracil reductase RibD [Dissulfurimicrobium sp.]|uniref:bifunctional diaminohydroxyphosphoribosylaminopyrimidine deaminase/5-amino-6-(5-phosphoribosylamino)uracil reductase RibD n=1 Tax=Dissulfurimicrobium TaxID=1769732 RepID=UPI001EDB99E8|nr:bifunctional diaminohydroxyphosphoribosylaminopyrimidine deaminase/5-amino-6-(5-phosphoribosylamino)uracil reductase RibD [Dissulfurimicrobium hydrothermale]UKL14573.1 bifunctional diaminohydroxyphosphoribosylaminopyrimidine deaminase/5-amino-6-(5-phosphoribosylamino)uracil reductase RibD [Dissulfurimicrobium hydrothermale]